MKKFFDKYFWTLLVVLAAIGLAVSAAYFSISGLSKLFGGSAMEVIIMASFIEFAKLVTTAGLHRYWTKIKWWMKYTLSAMVVAVMIITSSGIYGFLADAYSTTSMELDKIDGKIALIEKQQEQKRVQIESIETVQESKSSRVNTLNNLRIQQEARIDSLYNKGWYSSAKQSQALIDESSSEIKLLQVEIDSSMARVNRINQEIGDLDIQALELQNSDIAAEVGPLKYMSTVVGKPVESVINFFILMLIFVFDPLAVLLIIFASNIYDANNKREESGDDDKTDGPIYIEPEPEIIQSSSIHKEKDDEANQQRFVDAINTGDIMEFDYDFPEEKGGETIEYVENDKGEFEKNKQSSESLSSLLKGLDSNPHYLQLLDVLFLNGKKDVGDVVPPYLELVKNIEEAGVLCEDKTIRNFLMICNLLGITNMSNKDNVKIIKDYNTSKGIISLVSK